MKVEVKNLVLKYPIKNLDHYLFRARMLKKIKKLIFKHKNTNTSNVEEKPLEDGIVALKNINFTINSNDRLGLIGLNGSGKSTLLKCLSNILPHNEGSIKIEGAEYLPIIQPYAMCEPDDTLYNNIILISQILGFEKKDIKNIIRRLEVLAVSGTVKICKTFLKFRE